MNSKSGTLKLTLLVLCSFALPARGDFKVLSWTSSEPDRSEVRVTSALDRTPHRGFLPVKVAMENRSDRPQSWTLRFRSGYGGSLGDSVAESTFPLAVAAHSSAQHQLLIPLSSQFKLNRTAAVQASLYDGERVIASGYLQSHEPNTWTTVAVSKSVGSAPNLEELGTEIRSISSEVRTTEPVAILLNPDLLPPDWRALSGIDALVLCAADWRVLSPAVRLAVRDWVRLGNHLFILSVASEVLPSLQAGPDGLGTVELLAGDSSHVPIREIVGRINQLGCDRLRNLRDDFDNKWPLQEIFGSKNFNLYLPLLLLLAFAVLVGPVNLFVLANSQQRHRLMITVPAISAITGVLLMATIVLQDGFGGTGRRMAVLQIFASPEDRSACLTQEQVSRTGVLSGRTFAAPPGAFFSHVLMRRSRWTFFDSKNRFRARFVWEGSRCGGDWFRSRSEQGHFLQASQPTRGRIERLPRAQSQTPSLVSSFESPLSSLFYLDEAGKPWRSTRPVGAGEEVALEPVSTAMFEEFLRRESDSFSPFPAKALRDTRRVNQCYALVQNPQAFLIPTLSGIRWRDDHLLLVTQPVPRISASP